MPGVESSPEADVSRICQLLDGYKAGFAFLKELVQNAHDACPDGGGILRLVWDPGIPEAIHPLFQGPALIVLNSGPFEEHHRRGLCSLGFGSKGGEADSIGKFGLGSKAIFHVADAFFYLESSGDPKLQNIFTPWGDWEHADWDTDIDTGDWDLVRTKLEPYVAGMEPWFAIWIPLRREALGEPFVRGEKGAFPGESNKCPTSLIDAFEKGSPRIGDLLPLVGNLDRIEFWRTAETRSQIVIDRVEKEVSRGDSTESTYALVATKDDAFGQKWQDDQEDWPKVPVPSRTGKASQQPEKARWEHAVLVTRRKVEKPRRGMLRIYWSVFLPVGTAFVETPIEGSHVDTTVFLHGCFFPNDTRKEVFGVATNFKTPAKGDSDRVKVLWNRDLALGSHGVLAQLPAALWKMCEDHQDVLGGSEFGQLLAAIHSSPFWAKAELSRAVYQTHSLVFAHDGERWGWHCAPTENSRFVVLRAGDREHEEVLRGLMGPSRAEWPKVLYLVSEVDHGLHGKAEEFDAGGAVALRQLLPETIDRNRQTARALRRVLRELSELSEWRTVPLYEIRTSEAQRMASKDELESLLEADYLFGEDPDGLLVPLSKALGTTEIALFAQSASLPISPPRLTAESTAELLLRSDQFASGKARSEILRKLVSGDQLSEVKKKAIRFLLHGEQSKKEDLETPIFYHIPDVEEGWQRVYSGLLGTSEAWRTVPYELASYVPQNKHPRLAIHEAGSGSTNTLFDGLSESRLSEISPEDRLWLVGQLRQSDIESNRAVRIHELPSGELVAATDDGVLLQGEDVAVPGELDSLWVDLKSKARIVARSSDPVICRNQVVFFGADILDVSGTIRFAVKQGAPEKYADLIVHLLGLEPTVDEDLTELLDSASWLPVQRGNAPPRGVRPCQVVNLNNVHDQVRNVVDSSEEKEVFSVAQLLGLSQENGRPARAIRRLLPDAEQSVNLLVTSLSAAANYRLSATGSFETSVELERHLDVLSLLETGNQPPAFDLIRRVANQTGWEQYALTLAGAAKGIPATWDASDCVGLISGLEDVQSKSNSAHFYSVVSRVLAACSRSSVWNQLKAHPELRLPNRRNQWVEAGQIARTASEVDRTFLLHKDLVSSLPPGGEDISKSDGERKSGKFPSIDQSVGAVSQLLPVLQAKLPSRVVALLPALLYEDGMEELQEKARDLYDDLEPSHLRNQLGLASAQPARVRLERINGKAIQLESIAGSLFFANLNDGATTVFLPHSHEGGQISDNRRRSIIEGGEPTHHLRVCSADRLSHLDETELLEVMIESIEFLFPILADGAKPQGLRILVERLSELGQLRLVVSQEQILDGFPAQMRQLGVTIPALEEAIDAIGIASRNRAQERTGIGNVEQSRVLARRAEQEARGLFRDALTENEEVHRQMVEALKRKIGHNQYEVASIPFEFFQNADDAIVERQTGADKEAAIDGQFVVVENRRFLDFLHNGRPINYALGTDGTNAERWKRDLLNMLMVNASEKYAREGAVTGMFGLGFKSAFLLDEKPSVVSDALSFSIRAGIWPVDLESDREQELRTSAAKYLGAERSPTITRLNLPQGADDETLERFHKTAPWLPLFARGISSLRVIRDQTTCEYKWEPRAIGTGKRCRIGEISTDAGMQQYLEFVDDDLSWVFGLDENGVCPLPDHLPWLFVTAPCSREKPLGFLVNGPFQPDPGRICLSKQDSNRNEPLLERAGQILNEELVALITSNPLQETVVRDKEAFLRSLWNLFTKLPKPPALMRGTDTSAWDGAEQITSKIWDMSLNSGYSGFISEHPAIPTGLEAEDLQFARLEDLNTCLSGSLAKASGVRCLRQLSEAGEPVPHTTQVCKKSVGESLRRYLDVPLRDYTVESLFRDLGGEDQRLAAPAANVLGRELLTTEDGSFFSLEKVAPSEVVGLREIGESLKVWCEDGNWVSRSELLRSAAQGATPEEARRHKLAPPSHRLHSDYQATAGHLLREVCTKDSSINVNLLATWATGEESYRAQTGLVLQYLKSGDSSDNLALRLGPEWLEQVRSTDEWRKLGEPDQEVIEGRFEKAAVERKIRHAQGKDEPATPPDFIDPETDEHFKLVTPADLLRAWDEQQALREFTLAGKLGRFVNPADGDLNEALRMPSELEGKTAWYKMLCMGCTLSLPLGRGSGPVTSVSRLWERLGEEFWERTIQSGSGELDEGTFSEEVDSFFDEIVKQLFTDANASGEDARFWRRVFYDFRKIHHFVFRNHLPETILELADREEVDGCSLIEFLKNGYVPRAVQDPNMPRLRGVIGQSMTAPLLFVMRELCRTGVLPMERFGSAALYMNSPARRAARRLGWIGEDTSYQYDFASLVSYSETIYRNWPDEIIELRDHLDLPLQMLQLRNP